MQAGCKLILETMQNAVKMTNLQGLKIRVSTVRFCPWAQGNPEKTGRNESPASPGSPRNFAPWVQAGCKWVDGVLFALWALCLVAAVCTLLIGCGAPEPPLHFNYEGSDDSYGKAVMAAEAWNQACGAELVIVRRGEGDLLLQEFDGPIPCNGEAGGVYGCQSSDRIRFHGGYNALPTLAHEFGHALGLGHEAAGVMRNGAAWEVLDDGAVTIKAGAITAADCEEVRRVWRMC